MNSLNKPAEKAPQMGATSRTPKALFSATQIYRGVVVAGVILLFSQSLNWIVLFLPIWFLPLNHFDAEKVAEALLAVTLIAIGISTTDEHR